jgi:methyltransferase (TIGR00027 family)
MAEQDGSSKTALLVAAYRGRASAAKPPICSDPWATALAGPDGEALVRNYDRVYPHLELWVAVRTAFIDERIRRAQDPPFDMRQVVLLGAGLDTRAARLARPGVRFFEVDRASSQKEKLRRLGALEGYPGDAAAHVTCDFERDDFVERLVAAGFRTSEPAFVVWEGVVPYLSEPAVRATLRRVVNGLNPRSMVIFDHLGKKIVSGDLKDAGDLESRAFLDALGEPLRFGIDDALPLLYE